MLGSTREETFKQIQEDLDALVEAARNGADLLKDDLSRIFVVQEILEQMVNLSMTVLQGSSFFVGTYYGEELEEYLQNMASEEEDEEDDEEGETYESY